MQLMTGIPAFLLFLFMANLCSGDTGREIVLVFKGNETEVPYQEDNGSITIRKPLSFRAPAFVGGVFNGKEFFVVLCDARYFGWSDWTFIEGAARTSYGDYRKWNPAEIYAKNTRKNAKYSNVGALTAVMKGNKIYALTPSWDKSEYAWTRHRADAGWDLIMIVGTVTNSNGGGVSLKWDKGTSLKYLLPKNLLGAQGKQFIGGVGNGVVTKNGTIVFPIQLANTRNKYTSSIMYSKDDGSTWIMGKITESGSSEGSVVEWGDGKLILFTRYDFLGYRKVYETVDMGVTWKESLVFSRVWGNQPSRNGVGSQGSAITVPIDGEDVLLISHPLNTKGKYNRDTLQLWMSDGKRIFTVGTITEDGKGENSGYSILNYIGNHLYSVYEINPFGEWNNYDAKLKEWDRILALSPLSEFFESVKKTVREWRLLDAKLETIGIPTDVLVGFLGDNSDEYVWEDMYKCVKARVKGATHVKGGLLFDAEPGSGAQWPVRSQRQNQFYIFTRLQFTIAATVEIYATNETGDFSLLGASVDAEGNNVVLGIGYTQDNKWYAVHGNGVKISTEASLELQKEYHVALTFAKGVGSVYVDGVALINEIKLTYSTASINHFYMGGIGKSSTANGISGTVKNVLLFNRPLNQTEIDGLATASNNGKINEVLSDRGSMKDANEGRDSAHMNKSNNGTVMSFFFLAWVCLVYTVIVFMWL